MPGESPHRIIHKNSYIYIRRCVYKNVFNIPTPQPSPIYKPTIYILQKQKQTLIHKGATPLHLQVSLPHLQNYSQDTSMIPFKKSLHSPAPGESLTLTNKLNKSTNPIAT